MVVRPGLVLNLEEQVVVLVQFAHQPANESLLDRHRRTVVRRVEFFPVGHGDRLDVVRRVQRMDGPLLLAIRGTEERQLDDNSSAAGFGDEVREASEVVRVETVQVELVSASRVTRLLAARPRREKSSGCGGQGIPLDAERALRLDVTAGEDPRVIHSVALQRIQVATVVEVQIEHRAIMLGTRDQRHCLTTPRKPTRIVGMQADGLGTRLVQRQWFCGVQSSQRNPENAEHRSAGHKSSHHYTSLGKGEMETPIR